ncbi:ABC transporter ATP-binding protein [Vaginella massiliensis]|uniref:ABC transporter ATP-binding protein n=1 Tax=Vaginella massiliensis TaxID=1816680 RepID=UPI000839207D|nr:ABC transporter ATP-binding protein [Vaginella massiliensis]
MIKIDRLFKKYRGESFYSVEDLSLTIEAQSIFGILGPNGAGKTTLISLLCGLIEPTSGRFTIDGLDYKKDENKIKSLIGVVPQEYALYPTLTAKENLLYFGSMYGLKGARLKELVHQNLSLLGLEKFTHKRVESFSGGMKRRVNLIAGILHQPKVLFLDEPTVGVDVQSRATIIAFLTQLNLQGTTIVYTSHHLIEAQEFCTDIAIIDHGKIIAQGTPRGLIEKYEEASNLEEVFINLTGKALRDVV